MDPRTFRFLLASAAAGRHTFPTHRLFQSFRSPAEILHAPPSELAKVKGLHPSTIQVLSSSKEQMPDRALFDLLDREGIRLVSYESADYPELLRQIPDPPPVLFLKGRILEQDRRSVAVVGSRRASAYGTGVCQRLVRELVGQEFTVVSGMAQGIDTAAHWSALECGGRTAGVLGTGVDRIYPRSNARLFPRILSQGYLVSEFLPGTQARPENFPRRNRIISGLSWGVLVVEASERSGTMITVRMALEQGREVFAVPGDIRSPTSRGTHRLIQQGAKLAAGIDDILEELTHVTPAGNVRGIGQRDGAAEGDPKPDISAGEPESEKAGKEALPGDRGAVVRLLDDTGTGLDTLVRRSGLEMARLSSILMELELDGEVMRLAGNRYTRTRSEVQN